MRIKKLYILSSCLVVNLIFGQIIEPECLRKEYNFIQYKNPSVLKTFNEKWNSKNKITILHLGDSHLQNENFPNKCRQLTQQIIGDGGVGLIQPFSIVKSYNASFYNSTHTGNWDYSKSYMLPPKHPLGVRGMTAKTIDAQATFKIVFNSYLSSSNTVLSVFASTDDASFEPVFTADSIPAQLISKTEGLYKYILPAKYKTIQFNLKQTDSIQNQFVLYGMSLSKDDERGAIWHNAGVGACQYKSVLFEEKYEEQAKYLNSDLIIIDYGTNDFLYKNAITPELKTEILEVINKVRNANPNASIILTSAQNMNYKKINVTASKIFSNLVKTIAFENNCGFWDWYIVSGGPKSMAVWQLNKLAMDGIHLNAKGGQLKAILLVEALKNTNQCLNEGKEKDELIYEDHE